MKDWSHDVLNGGIQRKLEGLTEKSECVVLYCMNDLFSCVLPYKCMDPLHVHIKYTYR